MLSGHLHDINGSNNMIGESYGFLPYIKVLKTEKRSIRQNL